MFKYNKTRIEATLEEEEEEASRPQECGANKGMRMYHPFVISSSLPLGGVLHNPQRVVHIFH